jgi:hypothetical protein
MTFWRRDWLGIGYGDVVAVVLLRLALVWERFWGE